jgi:pSer/pThr/pTyr-binding forkhead associated (FHA) protein
MEDVVIICAKCGRENEDHYKFCLGCGASLADQDSASADDTADSPSCPNCDADVEPGQRFCGECGFNLEEEGGLSQSETKAKEAADKKEAEAKQAAEKKAKAPSKKDTQKTDNKAKASPSADVAGALILINPDGSPGDIVDLEAGENVVGRNSGPEVFANDPYLSPSHVRFNVLDNEVEIEDLDSLNGVFVRITDMVELSHGDLLRIGQEVLRFEHLDQIDPIIDGQSDIVTHGSRRGGAWGRLARISGRDEASTAFLLRANEHVIGRERGDILFRDDGYVSGTHARIFKDDDRVFVEDLKSSNGTFIKIQKKQTVRSGSLILLGKQPYRLQLQK